MSRTATATRVGAKLEATRDAPAPPADPSLAGKKILIVDDDVRNVFALTSKLERWEVIVDDSGGDPLSDTSAGRFACLAAQTALGGLAPVTLLALLKHPLTLLGATEAQLRQRLAGGAREITKGCYLEE